MPASKRRAASERRNANDAAARGVTNAFACLDRDDGGAGEDDFQPGATGTDALDAGGAIIDVPGSVDITDGDKGFLAAKKQLLRFSAYGTACTQQWG